MFINLSFSTVFVSISLCVSCLLLLGWYCLVEEIGRMNNFTGEWPSPFWINQSFAAKSWKSDWLSSSLSLTQVSSSSSSILQPDQPAATTFDQLFPVSENLIGYHPHPPSFFLCTYHPLHWPFQLLICHWHIRIFAGPPIALVISISVPIALFPNNQMQPMPSTPHSGSTSFTTQMASLLLRYHICSLLLLLHITHYIWLSWGWGSALDYTGHIVYNQRPLNH